MTRPKKNSPAWCYRKAVPLVSLNGAHVYCVWRHGDPAGRVLMAFHYATTPEAACMAVPEKMFDIRLLPEVYRVGLGIALDARGPAWPDGVSLAQWANHSYWMARHAHALAVLRFLAAGGDLQFECARQIADLERDERDRRAAVVNTVSKAQRKSVAPAPPSDEEDVPF